MFVIMIIMFIIIDYPSSACARGRAAEKAQGGYGQPTFKV